MEKEKKTPKSVRIIRYSLLALAGALCLAGLYSYCAWPLIGALWFSDMGSETLFKA